MVSFVEMKRSKPEIERRLYNLQERCRTKSRKVPETINQAFGMVKKLLHGAVAVNIPNAIDTEAECQNERKKELSYVREEQNTSAPKLEQL